MHDNPILGEEVEQFGVEVNFAKKVKIIDILNGDGLAGNFTAFTFLFKIKGVLSPPQTPTAEDVVTACQNTHLTSLISV